MRGKQTIETREIMCRWMMEMIRDDEREEDAGEKGQLERVIGNQKVSKMGEKRER